MFRSLLLKRVKWNQPIAPSSSITRMMHSVLLAIFIDSFHRGLVGKQQFNSALHDVTFAMARPWNADTDVEVRWAGLGSQTISCFMLLGAILSRLLLLLLLHRDRYITCPCHGRIWLVGCFNWSFPLPYATVNNSRQPKNLLTALYRLVAVLFGSS